MKKRIFTLLMGLLAIGFVNAQTEIFNPATFDGELASGMEIVDVDGVSYLQIVVDGWNSTLDIPVVSDILGTQINGNVKYSLGQPSIDAGLTLANISSVVQLMDTVNKVPPSWDPNGLVPAATSLTENPTTEGWGFRKADITEEMKFVHQIQFFGQQTTDWNPAVGDTMWVGRLISVDASVLFDPASVDVSTLPADMEIVEEGGEKLLKVKLNGWNTTLPINIFEVGNNNKWSFKAKYDAGESSVGNANAQIFIQAIGEAGSAVFSASVNPAPADLSVIEADAKMETVVASLQIAAQENSGDWPAVVGGYIYLSKITVSFEEAQPAPVPNSTVVAYSDLAKDITVDGLYDDAYGEVENVVNRVAVNETGSDITETNSNGVWLAVADLDNFYFYIEVSDNDPIALGESTSPWMNDGIELFMDIQDRRYIGGSRISGEQHQMRINYGTEGPAHGDGGDGVSFGMEAFHGDNDTTNIEFAIISSSEGYVIEARIPWATWYRTNTNTPQDALDAINLKEGMKIAFEVSILDADAPDGRKSILNWANNSGTDVAYQSNEYYGEIELKGGWPLAIAQKQAVNELRVYPNPAANQINIDMDGAASLEIYNVIGAKVATKSLNGLSTVDISNLLNGVYILKVTDVNANVSIAKINKK